MRKIKDCWKKANVLSDFRNIGSFYVDRFQITLATSNKQIHLERHNNSIGIFNPGIQIYKRVKNEN